MTGSGWSYAWRSMLWLALLFPTLGFAYPWRMAALERYKLGHTFYGALPACFEATGWALFKRVWWIWSLGLLPIGVLLSGTIGAAAVREQGFTADSPQMIRFGSVIMLGIALCIALPFLHAIRPSADTGAHAPP